MAHLGISALKPRRGDFLKEYIVGSYLCRVFQAGFGVFGIVIVCTTTSPARLKHLCIHETD